MSSERGYPKGLVLAVLILLAMAALGTLVQPLIELPAQIGRNHNEGWNAFHAASFASGAPLYPRPDALVTNNYPPLSFVLVGTLSAATGDTLLTGRWIALLSLVVVASCGGWVAASLTDSRLLGWFSALLLMGTMGGHYQNYVAMNDPQMLGHALQYFGLALFISMGEQRRWMVAALVLLLLGGLVKHNLWAVPLGMSIWLFVNRRRDFALWLAVAIALGAASVSLIVHAFGPNLIENLVKSEREYHIYLFTRKLAMWLIPIAPLLMGGVAVLLFEWTNRRPAILLLIAALSLTSGVLASFAEGMNYNAIFDVVFVACIMSAYTVHCIAAKSQQLSNRLRQWATPAVMVAISSTVFLSAPERAYRAYDRFQRLPELEAAARDDLLFVRSQPGQVMCEDPSVCYWAGKSSEVDFFNLSRKMLSTASIEEPLLKRIGGAEFGLIQLDRPDGGEFLSERANRSIAEHYELTRSSPVNGYFFVPRETGNTP